MWDRVAAGSRTCYVRLDYRGYGRIDEKQQRPVDVSWYNRIVESWMNTFKLPIKSVHSIEKSVIHHARLTISWHDD